MFEGLPRLYVALWFGSVVNRTGLLVVPMLTFYLRERHGFTLEAAGLVVAAFGLGQACSSVLGGALADRLGRRRTMLIALLGGAISMFGFGFVERPALFAPLAFGVALVTELYRPAVFAVVADTVPAPERARAYSLLYVAVNLGFAMAPALAGLLARYDFRWLFAGNALANLSFAAIVLRYVPETRPARLPDAPPQTSYSAVLRDGVFLRFVFSALLVGLIAHQGNVSLTGYMADQGHDEATYGLVVGWNGALIVLCQAGIGRRVGHLRPARVLAAGAALTGLGFSLHGVADAVPMHVLAVTVWTLGEMLQAPTCSTLVAALAPDDARGRYQGVFSLSWTLAAAIGPLWGPAVLARLGASELWGACLMLGLLGASVALRLEQPLVRRTASA